MNTKKQNTSHQPPSVEGLDTAKSLTDQQIKGFKKQNHRRDKSEETGEQGGTHHCGLRELSPDTSKEQTYCRDCIEAKANNPKYPKCNYHQGHDKGFSDGQNDLLDKIEKLLNECKWSLEDIDFKDIEERMW